MKKVSLIAISLLLLFNVKTFSSSNTSKTYLSYQSKSYCSNQTSSNPSLSNHESLDNSAVLSNIIEDDVDTKNKDKAPLDFFVTLYTTGYFVFKSKSVSDFVPQQFSEKRFLLHSVLRL